MMLSMTGPSDGDQSVWSLARRLERVRLQKPLLEHRP